MKIVVLAGGLSNERDVSLSSGTLVANALMENDHDVLLLDLYLGLDDISSIDKLFKNDNKYEYQISSCEPDLKKLIKENYGRKDQIGPNVIELCKYSDIVFIALHGGIGENGKLQALLDIHNIKYTGSSSLGSALAMDKDLTKQLLDYHGIKTAKWLTINSTKIPEIDLEYPLVVKPCSNGSSIGVFIVNNEFELHSAIKDASIYEEKVLIEEYIKGREFSVGVLGNNILPPIEIIPKEGFYDYTNKYQAGLTEEICPANLSKEQTKKLQEITQEVFKLLKLNNYARIDFILGYDKEFYCLEANTLPGMTPTSLLPQEAQAIKINYNQLCEEIVKLSK